MGDYEKMTHDSLSEKDIAEAIESLKKELLNPKLAELIKEDVKDDDDIDIQGDDNGPESQV